MIGVVIVTGDAGRPSLKDIGDLMKERESMLDVRVGDAGAMESDRHGGIRAGLGPCTDARYLVVRVDGRAFHTLTRGMEKPFDGMFIRAMDAAASAVMRSLQGSIAAYVQSDEASVIIEPRRADDGRALGGPGLPFNGRIQKIDSIAASAATGGFHSAYMAELLHRLEPGRGDDAAHVAGAPDKRDAATGIDALRVVLEANPQFDARVVPLADTDELGRYLTWRRMDCMRNAVSGIAQTIFTPGQLHGKGTAERWRMIQDKTGGMCVDDRLYWGRLITIGEEAVTSTYTDGRDGSMHTTSTTRSTETIEAATRANTDRFLDRLRPERNGDADAGTQGSDADANGR